MTQACRVLELSRAGYYQHQQRGPHQADVVATVELMAAFADSGRSILWQPAAGEHLAGAGMRYWSLSGARLMREAALRPVWQRQFVHTTASKHDLPVAANLLDRQFAVAAPNQAGTSDITYVRTRQGWLYLAAVMDLFSRKIIGWAMAPTMPTELVAAALRMALQQRKPPPGLLLHSARGS